MQPFFIGLLAAVIMTGCGLSSDKKNEKKVSTEPAAILSDADYSKIEKLLAPLPEAVGTAENPLSEAKVALGKRLFLDEALSNPEANNGKRISCNTCHLLDQYGVDGIDRSIGILEEKVPVNAPTVYNAALHIKQFWDGRADTVEEQALGPITALKEMGFTSDPADQAVVMDQLKAADAAYPDQFAAAFPGAADAFTFENVGNAIGAFERTLLTPSKFDTFLKGDKNALNEAEKRGLKIFLNAGGSGCVSCHSGVAVGGDRMMALTGTPDNSDALALAAYADVPELVKVPSLRNIDKTGPYYHNGAVASLDDAIRIMAEYQLGVTFSDAELVDLKAFLGALTGDLPAL